MITQEDDELDDLKEAEEGSELEEGSLADDEAGEAPEDEPWEQQADEPELWYQRFVGFREMGVGRSVRRAYQLSCKGAGGQGEPRQPPNSWRKAARQFDWVERAAAWDRKQTAETVERFERLAGQATERAERAMEVLTSLLEAESETQRRLAAESILQWTANLARRPARPREVESVTGPIRWIAVAPQVVEEDVEDDAPGWELRKLLGGKQLSFGRDDEEEG